VALEQFGAGPWATAQLTELGAEVIKIERPGPAGDMGRYVPPYQQEDDSLFFETFNKGKRSVCLDVDHPEGRAAFRAIARSCDAVFSNLRGDQAGRLGLTYERLRDVNPRLVCCSLSGFGSTGPRAAQPAYDPIIQALAGWMDLTGDPAGPPTKTGISLVDFAGGYVASLAVLAGVHQARREGVGLDCDISLFETALSLLTYFGTWTASTGYEARRMPMSAHASLVPFQAFPTSTAWLVVACAKEKFWRLLCASLGREDLLEDERFTTFARRDQHRDELLPELERAFRSQPAEHWIARLEEQGVPCAPVRDVESALADPHVAARDGLVEYEHEAFGRVVQVRSSLRLGDYVRPPRPAPRRGADSRSVLTEIAGYSADEFESLVQGGVTVDPDALAHNGPA
jgi:crotonobetainyl-CoA:carnitine CoA-transferase CaiB-like acyl-CoA transferase